MKRSIHVRIRKVAEPFGEFLLDLRLGKPSYLVRRRGLDLEKLLLLPALLVLNFEAFQKVSLACLEIS